MLSIIERFLLLRHAISKALVDLSGEMNINEAEFKLLEDLKFTLEPIKVAVEALCTKDATLRSCIEKSFLMKTMEFSQSGAIPR